MVKQGGGRNEKVYGKSSSPLRRIGVIRIGRSPFFGCGWLFGQIRQGRTVKVRVEFRIVVGA